MRSWICLLVLGFLPAFLSCSGHQSRDAGWAQLDTKEVTKSDGAFATGGTGHYDGAILSGGSTASSGGNTASSGGAVSSSDASQPSDSNVVSNQTLDGLFVMGYQGWFTFPQAPTGMPRWVHWTNSATPPAPDNVQFDAWPDLSEFTAGELQDTSFEFPDGRVAGLYSATTPATVDRHMRWAKEYGIDGFFLQRFLNEVSSDPVFKLFRDTVTKNFLASTDVHGRVFAVEYDLSGAKSTWLEDLKKDWQFLVDTLKVTESDRYLHHRGLPLLVVWGLGFTDRPGTPTEANAMIDWFTKEAPAAYRVTLVGGIPTHWRTLTQDSKTDPDWAAVYRRFSVIHPWMVGRYRDDAGVEDFMVKHAKADIAEAKRVGADFLPVLFPGFSWANLKKSPAKFNEIPRRGGSFFWKQFYEFVSAGCTMAFGAMFDEVDEATAMFKIAASKTNAPTTGTFLTLDADGQKMSSDFYLRLAGAGAHILHRQMPLSSAIPVPLFKGNQ